MRRSAQLVAVVLVAAAACTPDGATTTTTAQPPAAVTLASRQPIDLEVAGDPIAVYNTGVWDDYELREPGAPIYDPGTDAWICPYTGRDSIHAFGKVGAVVSADGRTWTSHQDNPLSGGSLAEDPYIAKNADGAVWRDSSGRALMFVEEKTAAAHRGVELWRSAANTLDGWTLDGRVLDRGSLAAWDETDRTSPTVIYDGSQLVMLYEGRLLGPGGGAPDPNEGEIGIAFSADEGETWTASPDPIVPRGATGSWNERATVPDDLIRVGGEWVLLAHGQDSSGWWSVGRFITIDDPVDWNATSFAELPGNPMTTGSNTVMAWGNDPSQAMQVSGDGRRLEHVITKAR